MFQPPRKTQLGVLEKREGEPGLPHNQLGSKGQAANSNLGGTCFKVDLQLPSTTALQKPGSCNPSHGWVKHQGKPHQQHGSSSPLWGNQPQMGTIFLDHTYLLATCTASYACFKSSSTFSGLLPSPSISAMCCREKRAG